MIKDWGNKPICRIDVTGFLSILVVLIFTYLVHLMDEPDRPVVIADLPKAHHAISMSWANREDAMIVTVMRDSRIGFGNRRIALQDLRRRLQDGLRSGSEKRVYINADARARYQAVAAVLDQIRLAGIEKVSFLTEQSR